MPIHRTKAASFEVLFGALAGVDIIAVIQLTSVTQLDEPLRVALYCFAVGIPVLCLYLVSMALLMGEKADMVEVMWYHLGAMAIGPLASLGGLSALFYHFSAIMAVIFAALSLAVLWMVLHYIALLQQKRDKKQD